ncbi:PGC [Symbiodinium pilosum]|uniref:PGC protein n=1 Tax=Symbiodinium pilosum TaxID=2952 RepID=A0A812KMM5_SYMPI|nr:PGC [Symbiodinium pilosum]
MPQSMSMLLALGVVLATMTASAQDVESPRQLRGSQSMPDVDDFNETEDNETSEEAKEETPAPSPSQVQIWVPDPSEVSIYDGQEEEEDPALEEARKEEEAKKQLEREEAEGGTCCFSGESSQDTCGTCFPMSIASYKSKCSRKRYCLGECKGTWCETKCILGAASDENKCGTAYPDGIATSGSSCASSSRGCASCNGEWCRAGYASNFHLEEDDHGRETPVYVAPEETDGICCYRGKTGADNMCGACTDVAKDSTCSVKSHCGGCGGTWCPRHGPKCVKAFKDAKNPCHTAFPNSGIASADEYCALNKKQCDSCNGAWCAVGNITYSDGTKYDPNQAWAPENDQRLEEQDEAEIEQAHEEVSHDDTIEDLFPEGLADHGMPGSIPEDEEEDKPMDLYP